MKRYRVLPGDFDTRNHIIEIEIKDEWEDKIKQMHIQNKKNVLYDLEISYGKKNFDQKFKNYRDIGASPFSVIAYHNKFLQQSRNSFVISSYYPALTGVCALGERVLNHLIIKLRDQYKHKDEYKRIYRKESFDRWEPVINTLSEWDIFLPETTAFYKELLELRNNSIHFNLDTEINIRENALEALLLFQKIIDSQFTSFGNKPWFITTIPGEIYIKKEWETHPFIKEVYLPNSIYVGPKSKVISAFPWKIEDEEYESIELSDEKFASLRNSRI